MRMNGKSGFALVLIVCGGLILLGNIGWLFGWLLSYLIPISMIIFGFIGLQNGKKVIGLLLMAFGGIFLIGKFTGWIALIIAIGLIAYGFSLLKSRNAY